MAYIFLHELALVLNNHEGRKLRKDCAKKARSRTDAARVFNLRLQTNLSRSVSSLSSAFTADASQASNCSSSRRQSVMRRLSVSTIEYFSSQAGTPDTEIESFLAGGRANPNPYLHEVHMIAEMDLGSMTIAQIKEALKSPHHTIAI